MSPAGPEEAYLVNALVTLREDNWGVYGARKLWHAARRAGIEGGRDQVARLMKVAGISGAVRRLAPDPHHGPGRGQGAAAPRPGQATGRAVMRSPGRPALRREVERAFWRKIAEGLSTEDARSA